MYYGIDSEFPPANPASLKPYADWYGVYINGYRASHIWSPADVNNVAKAGFQILPITVWILSPSDGLTYQDGIRYGQQDTSAAKQYGFRTGSIICFDIEAGIADYAISCASGWITAVRQSGFRPCIYAPDSFCHSLASFGVSPNYVWASSWFFPSGQGGLNFKANPITLPGMFVNDQQARQYAGGITVAGVDVDASVSTFPMNQLGQPAVPITQKVYQDMDSCEGPNERTDIVVIGKDAPYNVYHSFDPALKTWENLGGSAMDVSCSWNTGFTRFRVIARGWANDLYYNDWTTAANGWSGWIKAPVAVGP